MRRLLRALLVLSLFTALLPLVERTASAATENAAPTKVSVIVPEANDLKLLSFWVALGEGFFREEGFDMRVVSPDRPSQADAMFASGEAPVAVLSSAAYGRLIEQHVPFVLAANLLANDPYDLVVKRDFAERSQLTHGLSVRRRFELLQGARIGVAPQVRGRLSLLFRTQGLDVNNIRVVPLRADEQVAELAAGHVDGLYTGTPYLEKALLDGDAVMVVDASAGEVPAFSERMVEALAVNETYAKEPGRLAALSRAVAKAEQILRNDRGTAEAAVMRALPGTDRRLLSYLISLYAPAIPPSPHVEAHLIARESEFFATGSEKRLAESGLAGYVFDDGQPSSLRRTPEPGRPSAGTAAGAGAQRQGEGSSHRAIVIAALIALLAALGAVISELRERQRGVG